MREVLGDLAEWSAAALALLAALAKIAFWLALAAAAMLLAWFLAGKLGFLWL